MTKVLLIHNYYQLRGGEDQVVERELNMLRSRGIEAESYYVHNDSISQGIVDKAKVALNVTWSLNEYRKVRKKIMDMRPDVVHVHNFFPIVSPSVYYACESMAIPVVQTLHNYRLICPAATFMREGEICEKCLSGSLINSVKYGCYRGSALQTLPLAAMIKVNKMLGTWTNKVSKYIALTDFSRTKFIASGIPEEKIMVKPNFIKTPEKTDHNTPPLEKYLLYVGRISPEKGVENLLKAWDEVKTKSGFKLVIIGDGPDKERLEQSYQQDDVLFLGKMNSDEVLFYMSHSHYLVVPSIWYEGFPLTIVEAYSVATPVLCSKIGSLEEVVIPDKTGFHFKHNDIYELAQTMEYAINLDPLNYSLLRKSTLDNFERKYTEEINYQFLMNIYHEAIEENRYGIAIRS
ncbi:glycosyltransferase family 4 protein [Paenibacillus provencensis]|uniref:Glycosyltransferase family 4 protein n=1 Tax=Paenibacillus provencensis TaxID=441151 RepID=A0ABW3PU76_9BACL|nr:glycosyltransferase family 4 protein [Paenibacillus sp. MER 78]